MTIPPRRLLVATDFSAGADCAADAAIALAARLQAEIEWLHVCGEPGDALTPSGNALVTQALDRAHREAREGLEVLQERARAHAVKSRIHLESGRPPVEVARCADETGSDWVVVGTHGRSGIQSWLIGNVAEKIARTSPVSVLCVRSGWPGTTGGTIVYGEDLASDDDRQAAIDLARLLEAQLVAVHGVELPAAVMADTSFSPPPALLESTVKESRERLDELKQSYGPGAETVVALGSASAALCNQARRRSAVLIVTGTAARSGVERWMLGSVAEKTLRHAPCSVLILKGVPKNGSGGSGSGA